MDQVDTKDFVRPPSSQSTQLIDFDAIAVVPGIVEDTFFLIVAGTKPWITMSVRLEPVIYIAQPDYWEIRVVATQSGIGLPQTAPYQAVLDISYLRGIKGIEVVGATRREKRDI